MVETKTAGPSRAIRNVAHWTAIVVIACGVIAFLFHTGKGYFEQQKQDNEAATACAKVAVDAANKLNSMIPAKASLQAIYLSWMSDEGAYSCRAEVQFTAGKLVISKEDWTIMGGAGAPYTLMHAPFTGVDQVDELSRAASERTPKSGSSSGG